jgi:hypothetical protein
MNEREATPEIRRIITAMVGRQISLCLQRGVSLERFYAVMGEVEAQRPPSLSRLFELVWGRLGY